MAKKRKRTRKPKRRNRILWFLLRWIWRVGLVAVAVIVLAIDFYRFVNPPTTPYILSEGRRLDGVRQEWVALDQIAPVMARAAVTAEDANFCLHWGFDMGAIRAALDEGAGRGASTITQQTIKNTWLWHGRSWIRKVLEAGLTMPVELLWPKWRILEIYLNVAEFDEGVFGVEAAARHYFGVGASDLTAIQASRLAAILPNPKNRSARSPSEAVRKRSAAIRDGAATIRADGRADCFEG